MVELKSNSNPRELIVRDLVLNSSPSPSMKTQFSKGVLPSLNSSHFFIKSFVLFPSQTFCSPSHSLISSSSTYCAKTHFDFKILFKNNPSQSVRHSFCEVGLLSTFFDFIVYFHIVHNQLYCMVIMILMPFYLMTIADMCLILVEPTIWLLWAFNNPLDLRTDPLHILKMIKREIVWRWK